MKILRDQPDVVKIRLILPELVVLSERKTISPRRFRRLLLISGSVVLSLLLVTVLYFSPIVVIEKRTSGDITFTDSAGNQLNGIIELSGTGISSGLKPNVNSIIWTNIPNARVYFNAFGTKGISINLKIAGNSPKSKVMLENYGSDLPEGINTSAPGVPIKYMELSTAGVSFEEVEIYIPYTDSELKVLDEKTLAIYSYDSAALAWSELPTKIDAKNNILSTIVNSVSIIAVIAKGQKIEIHDTKKTSIASDIKTYDETKTLRKTSENTDTLSVADISDKGEVEINALSNKNVAVKLKINRVSGGEIVLDDYGKNNPVSVPLPGKPVKFVEIGAKSISYSSAIITIHYSKAELDGADENSLIIYHWNGATWEALPTTVDAMNNTLSATTGALSPFGVSTGYGYINAIIARKVILDEPWGTGWNPDPGSGGGNWLTGVSLSQYVYVVVINNSGFPIQGANITGFYTAANGSANLFPFSGTTDAYGEFNTSTSLDNHARIGQTSNGQGPDEGVWNVTINVTYNSTTTSVKRDFILGEYGCGRSGSLCHQPLGGIAPKGSAMLSFPVLSHDPYIEGVGWASTESMHIVYAGNPPTNTMHEGQVDADYGKGPGITQGTSCTTCHRGYDQAGYNTTLAYLDTGVVLTTKGDVHDVNGVKCKDCHQNFTYTYEQRRYEVPQCYNSTCHANTTNIPKTWVQSRNNSYSWNQRAHDTNQTISCIFCHGSYHNITKPNSTIPGDDAANGITESEHCLNNCHKNQRYHNGSGGVQCTVCHSQAAHEIRYFNSTGNYTYNRTQSPSGVNVGRNYSGKCSTCHQKPYFANLLNNTKNPNDNYSAVNGSYSKGISGSKLVADPLSHSNALNNGTKWGNYWNASTDSDSCMYCHGNVYNNVGFSFTESAEGHIVQFMGNNTINSSISSSTYWCASCHWQGYTSGGQTYSDMVSSYLSENNSVPPEITGNATYGANQNVYEYTNHSLYSKDDSACNRCHGYGYGFAAITQFMHNQSRVGGPNCVDCHDTGGIALLSHVNVTATNDTNAIHKNLNSDAAVSNNTGYYSNNKRCWACHGNGTEPSPNAHPVNYKTPYNCTNCHVPTTGQNLNYTPNNTLLNVTQHYWNGTNISTASATSCYSCHNKSEMMISANDSDSGTGAVYGGANGGNNSTSHYGKKRTDYSAIPGTNDYCYRCHNNASTVFPFSDTNNRTILNHSMNYNSTNPACSDCHSTGRIHNSTLTKPSLSLPNSTYCTGSCHGTGGTATIRNLSQHNGTVNCTQCHLNSTRSIHPVRYLEQAGTSWNQSRTNSVNCTNCHQAKLANFSNAPLIPDPLKHSGNQSNGSIWGTYWTSGQGSCYYCHNNTKHNGTALGRISTLMTDGNNTRNGSITVTTWCADCHYNATNTNYKVSAWQQAPPLITVNNTGRNYWTNHSTYLTSGYKDSNCNICHALNGSYLATSLNYSHSLDEGIAGGPDCISCHDINGGRAPENKRIKTSSMKLGVHKNLNSNATNSSSIDQINKACWACHGNGSEPAGHPQRYRTPRECSNNDCHSLSQSFKAPMVYSHFRDAGLNSNPGNITSYNVSTRVLCEACHSNSLSAENANLNASVSHYATRDNLMDSINCIYCHLDRDNSIKWGNATEINKNRSSLVDMDRYKNKFTAHTGDFVDLGNGYRMKVTGISTKRDSALIELYKGDNLADFGLVNIGRYVYEETRIIDNASSRIPVIVLNITEIFVSENESFLQFEGFRIKRLHSENKTTSCYLCHFKGSIEKHKYTVVDRVDKDVFYTEVLFNSSDSKEYDQLKALQTLANKTPRDMRAGIERPERKTLFVGEKWKLAEDYSFTLENIAENSDSASFLLEIDGKSFTYVVKKGEIFDYKLSINYLGYTYTNITIFSTKVSEISQNIVVLEDTVALSPNMVKIDVNSTIYGYNASWLWKNNTFMVGIIPSDMHAPLLYDGSDGGAACTSCHNVGELGAHKGINEVALSSVASENKACWACHGEGKEPKWHPAKYKNPRKCKSCHVEQETTYNATYIGDEKHGALVNCNQCHVVDTHKIRRFEVVPGIKRLSISKEEIYEGEKVRIYATAVAGYEMKIRGAEYYLDSLDKPSPMLPIHGSFDKQIEEVTAELDTIGLKSGNHSIYVRAMERDNKWGTMSSISFIIKEKEIVTKKPEKIPDVAGFFILILIILAQHIRKNKLLG